MSRYEGKLLVASPYLRDSNFARSVILILEHNENGAFGVVLNRPTRVPVEQIWQRLSRAPCPVTGTVDFGGPVPGSFVLLTSARMDDLSDLAKNWPATQRRLSPLAAPLRLFAGHAQWTSGQLERELRQGMWLVQPATIEIVFADHEQMWHETLQQIGRSILALALPTECIAIDPSVN